MSLFHIKCECGNKISKYGWRLEKRKDGKSEYINICKKCGNKYIKSDNIFLKWFGVGEGILSFNLAVVVTFLSSIYINGILNIFIIFFIFLILFIFLEILIANIGYKKYLEKE